MNCLTCQLSCCGQKISSWVRKSCGILIPWVPWALEAILSGRPKHLSRDLQLQVPSPCDQTIPIIKTESSQKHLKTYRWPKYLNQNCTGWGQQVSWWELLPMWPKQSWKGKTESTFDKLQQWAEWAAGFASLVTEHVVSVSLICGDFDPKPFIIGSLNCEFLWYSLLCPCTVLPLILNPLLFWSHMILNIWGTSALWLMCMNWKMSSALLWDHVI